MVRYKQTLIGNQLGNINICMVWWCIKFANTSLLFFLLRGFRGLIGRFNFESKHSGAERRRDRGIENRAECSYQRVRRPVSRRLQTTRSQVGKRLRFDDFCIGNLTSFIMSYNSELIC